MPCDRFVVVALCEREFWTLLAQLRSYMQPHETMDSFITCGTSESPGVDLEGAKATWSIHGAMPKRKLEEEPGEREKFRKLRRSQRCTALRGCVRCTWAVDGGDREDFGGGCGKSEGVAG